MSTPTTQRRSLRAASWAAVAALSAGFLFGNSAALAAAPPANTIIGNQASAAYLDPNGLAQTATSNLVQTTVQQVGSFTLDSVNTGTATYTLGTTPEQAKTGAAGATVYVPHTLTNTGNGADGFNITVNSPAGGFSTVAVFADVNGDGMPDTTSALCTATPAATCTVPTQTVAGNGGEFKFVVAYTIPSTATTPATPFSTGDVVATAATPALYTAPFSVTSARDNVNLTTVAAFSLTKAVTQPAAGVLAPGGVAWPAAPVAGPRSDSASCGTTLVAALAPVAGCQYTVYTLTFSNTGGAAGAFEFSDALPSGFTYVAGSAVWSNAPGAELTDTTPGMAAFDVTGQVISGEVASLPVNTTQTISFIVLVNNTAALGTTTTTNTALYSATDGGPVTAASNPASYTVTGTYSIALGSAASTAATALDAVAGTPNAGVEDTTTVASAPAGSAVPFTVVVYNTGNATDTVNITGASVGTGGGTVFPAGTTFTYFKADGFTPLSDSNADGTIDTGPIPAGTSLNIVVKANLPANVALAGPAAGYTLTVTGTSAGNPAKIDATRDVLNAITGVLVDLTNTAIATATDIGTGPSATPTTTNTVNAGATTVFPLFVANGDTGFDNVYTLSAGSTPSMGALPAGWTVTFTSDLACTTPITILTVNAGAQGAYFACVSVPATQAPVTAQPIYFEVRSLAPTSTGAVVVDTKFDAVTVTAAAPTFGATLTPNNVGQVAPGGSIVYAHTLTNTGTGVCTGDYNLAATLAPADVTAGWTAALYEDVNGDGQIDAGDTLITGTITGPLNVGIDNARKYLVKVFAPGGATAGTVSTATVAVDFLSGPCASIDPSATDTTTVITGQIRLVKTQALDINCDGTEVPVSAAPLTAKPAECIVYRVVATNEGAAPVSNLTIFDAVPAWTTLTGAAQPTVQCESTGVSPVFTTASNYVQNPSDVSCGSASNVVQPGGTATLTFSVKIQN